MAALEPGTTAPDFTLPAMDGKQFSLREALARGPVLAAFFKISCPTCQYAFPFLQRIYEAHGNKAVTIVGISQNSKKDTAAFIKEYGITFPVLLDDTSSYPVSNAYGLTNVPTIFWIAQDGEIEISSVGWMKKEMEEFNQRAQTPARRRHSRCSTRTNRSPTSAPVEARRTSPRSRAKSVVDLRLRTSDFGRADRFARLICGVEGPLWPKSVVAMGSSSGAIGQNIGAQVL